MKKIKKIILILLTLVIISQPIFFVIPTSAAESEEDIKYTNVYNDLIDNKDFNIENYPSVSKSDPKYSSLEVITIAESENGELFVYVYQPSANSNMKASYITIGLSEVNASSSDVDAESVGAFKLYSLTYINSYNQFFKYKVDGLKVSSNETRYYEVTDILRPFSKDFGDEDPGADNNISSVSYPVGKFFTFSGTSGERSSLSVEDIEYITVTNKFVGYIAVEQDGVIYDGEIQLHFLAFSTDFPIDKLIEAYVYYETQDYYESRTIAGYKESWGEIENHYITIDDKSTIEFEVSDGFIHKESFELIDQILPTSKFLNQHITISRFPGFSTSEKIVFGDEERAELLGTDWVLTFAKTYEEDTYSPGNGDQFFSTTRVGNVKLLRLRFMTDDKIYNLGVVDNMQTGSNNPSAVVEEEEWFQKLVLLIIVMICMLAIYIFLDIYAPWLAKIIRWVVGAFWWLFTSLVKLITWPFRALLSNVTYKVKKKLKVRSSRRKSKRRRGRPSKKSKKKPRSKKETRNQRLMKETFSNARAKASEMAAKAKAKASSLWSDIKTKIRGK